MSADNKNTIRNKLLKVCSLFNHIDVALFCTFNFNGDFFEENVLPTLFVIDEDANRAVRAREVHKALAKTSVGVFYDPSVAKPSGKPYRYTHYPMFVPGSLFHAKNIFLIGTDKQGIRWIYVATLSGNLNLSGWGSNCEVMADTWVHSRSEQPWIAMNKYLLWLQKQLAISKATKNPLSEAITLMGDSIRERRTLADPEDVPWQDKEHLRLYFSPLHDSFWEFACENMKDIRSIKVASPYWGSVKQCIELLRERVHFSPDMDIALVMGRLPIGFAKTGLGMEESNDLTATWKENIKYYVWNNEPGRFYHLKLYRFETDQGTVSAVGSCNCTRPGLFWKWGSGYEGEKGFGNVESMMLDRHEGVEWPTQEAHNNDFDEKSTADEAPKPWPFYVAVCYDWKSCEYTWSLKGNTGNQPVLLKTSDFAISITETAREGKQLGRLTSSLYTIQSAQFGDVTGFVTELNLHESTREYSTPLATDLILQSWLRGAAYEPMPEPKEGDSSDNIEYGVLTASNEDAPVFFEFFDFYRATASLKSKLFSCVSDDDFLELSLWRSDSVVALGSAIIISKHSSTVKYLVLNECIRLMKIRPGTKTRLQPSINRLRRELDKYRLDIKQALAQELNKEMKIDAGELLSWYERQFRSAAE